MNEKQFNQNKKLAITRNTEKMFNTKLSKIEERLKQYAGVMNSREKHLKHLVNERNRIKNFSLKTADFFYDFSRQRVDEKVIELLLDLSDVKKIKHSFKSMMSGKKINITENRAALHTAARSFSQDPVFVNGEDIMPDIRTVRQNISTFVSNVHNEKITGSTEKSFEHIVVIGIGGSYLGTEFVSESLFTFARQNVKLYYLSNVDIHNFGKIVSLIDPETTLWIVISKSYTTAETMANTKLAYAFMKKKGLDPSKHFVTVTAKGSPGDNPENPVLATFNMFDFIGGRYSVTSAVGGVPLGLCFGYDVFERFLKGANEMDIHACEASPMENIPLMAALISIWNNNFLGYQTQGIIPYASPLSKLAPHIQQLSMESNGKAVKQNGEFTNRQTGAIIFGEPGTNAQHSFFQLAHQGIPFPIDFIGIIEPHYKEYQEKSKGVTNHQELWSNMISQAKALAMGKDDNINAKYFPGNRPSSTIILNNLSPENVGRLLAFYEAKTVFEAFIWGINPFDQFGVELGKILATDVRKEIAAKNNNPEYKFDEKDQITKCYMDMLCSD